MQHILIIIHLSSVLCCLVSVVCCLWSANGPSTTVENPLQIDLFMQNKPNFQKSQMNVSNYLKMTYENKYNWTLGENKPKQSQFQTQFQHLLHPQRDRVEHNYLPATFFPFTSYGPSCYNHSVHSIHIVRNIQ